LTAGAQVNLLERHERAARRLPVGQHRLINVLSEHAAPAAIGGSLRDVMADRLRITRGEAKRRVSDAELLGPRMTFTGEPLEPLLPATAAAQAAGDIGGGHVREIRRFFKQLPGWVDEPTREQAERDLVKVAGDYRPDELRRAADTVLNAINPDGDFTDEYRAAQRGLTIGKQGDDGMSRISGYLTPQCRAGFDAVLAKCAAPGMCNPEDSSTAVDGQPSDEAITGDQRTTAQRNHDALNAMLRSVLMSGELGSHQGLPVTIVATVDLKDLQNKTGVADTGGGTTLPVTDLIRMAAHAYNYLLIFDNAKRCRLYKGRSTRLATPAQRLVLYATERGCTKPGCTVPPYWCQVHHATKDFGKGGRTNIDELTLACGPDNRLATDGGWKTRKRKDAITTWKPPPHSPASGRYPHGGQSRINRYHHPERYLKELGNEDEHDDI
jgi:hypothetical protein